MRAAIPPSPPQFHTYLQEKTSEVISILTDIVEIVSNMTNLVLRRVQNLN